MISLREQFEAAWKRGERPRIEEFLKTAGQDQPASLLVDLLVAELILRRATGDEVNEADYRDRFPAALESITRAFQKLREAAEAPDERIDDDGQGGRDATRTYHPAELMPRTRFGRYTIERELGHGGMGKVFLALDKQLDRRVALKVPSFDHEDDDAIERFYREARAMATVHHPNLCPVFDVGEIDGRHFLTMAYIEGETLADYLHRNDRMPPKAAAELLRKVTSALEKAHLAGIVHRDLKPRNIMLTPDGEPIIMDFGLARRNKSGEADLTHSGVILGSPAYMSPEQVESRNDDIGPATDVWALGVIFYQMVCGRRPFEGSVPSLLGQILGRDPDPPSKFDPSLPPAVDAICQKALSKEIGRRQQSAKEFSDELEEVLGTRGAPTHSSLGNIGSSTARRMASKDTDSGSLSRRRREAELRQVTVVVFNYDPSQSQVVGAESELDVSRAFTNFVTAHVKRYGGNVIPGTGQEVLACFGFPVAYEDAAQRAIHSALHVLAESANSSDSRLPRSEHTWAVIHTGDVIAEDTGMESGISLIGDARNTALRLDVVADPGTVLISRATQQQVRLFFECDSAGERRVRGLAQPVELFRVLREASSRNKIELIDPGNLTPLIGRDTELRILKDRWEQTLEELGQVVLLIGDAGLGKSRLIREIREHVAKYESDKEPAIIEFRCSQHHLNAGFFPVVEYLQRLLDFESHPANQDRLQRMSRYLGGLGLESNENVVLLAELMSVPLDEGLSALQLSPQRKKELTEELLRSWLRELADRRPVLFVVEDLHWVDPSTLEMLGKLIEHYDATRMLTIFTFRSEFQTPWRSFPHQTQIALNRLTKRQVADMVQRRLKRRDLPDEVIKQLVERTDGVPLFIEEFANVLMESGALDSPGALDAAQLVQSIPATLQDLLIARLDRMDSNPEVVQLASAIGREFSYSLLAAICELKPEDLRTELDKLVRAEILFQKGRIPDAQFIFKHALIQDSAYRSLLKKRRQQFHLRIASTLESQFPALVETRPDLLAQHFTEAEVFDKATGYWQRAGQLAQQRCANQEAIAHYRQGLELLAHQPPSPQRDGMELSMTVPMGVAMLAAKGYANPEAGPVFDQARELGERVAAPPMLFYILWGSWAWRLVRCDLGICQELSGRILSIAEKMADPSWTCEAHFVPAVNHFYGGDFENSRHHAEESVKRIDPARCAQHLAGTGQDVRSGAYSYLALSQWPLGLVDQALASARRAVEESRALNHPMSLAFALNHAAWLFSFSQRWAEALPLAEEAERLATEQSLALWMGMAQAERGVCLIGLGRVAEGLPLLQSGYEAFAGTGARNVVPRYLALLAAGHLALGQLADAQQWLDRAFGYAQDYGGYHHFTETLRLRGDLSRAREPNNIVAAEGFYREAITDAHARHAIAWELRATLSLAHLHCDRATDRLPATLEQLRELLAQFTEGKDSADYREAVALLDAASAN